MERGRGGMERGWKGGRVEGGGAGGEKERGSLRQ